MNRYQNTDTHTDRTLADKHRVAGILSTTLSRRQTTLVVAHTQTHTLSLSNLRK